MVPHQGHICRDPARRRFPRGLLIALASLVAAAPGFALDDIPNGEDSSRPFTVGLSAGVRSFDSNLDLEDEMTFGLRMGLGASERVTVLLDVLHSSPARETTGESAQVTALRGLAQVRLLLGVARPYLIAGAGGLLFNFGDASDAAAGAVTAGGGVEFRIAGRARLYVEGSADIYRARSVSYSSTGSELSSTERDTETLLTALAGVSVEF